MEDAVAYEMLEDGTLQERNMGLNSDVIAGFAYGQLHDHVKPLGLGYLFLGGTGLQMFPGRPRRIPRADVGYISKARLGDGGSDGYLQVVPELLVEVVSPNDTVREVEAKVAEYLTGGVSLVWVVKPDSRAVEIWRADGSFTRLAANDTITGEDVLPGFSAPVRSFFP